MRMGIFEVFKRSKKMGFMLWVFLLDSFTLNSLAMKKLIFLAAIVMAFAFTACEKEVITPYVAITGNFINTPDPSAGFVEIPMPDGSVFTSPKQYKVSGTSALFGTIDEAKSTLVGSNMAFDPIFGGFKGNVTIKLVDREGDELVYVGEFYNFQDFSNKSYLHVDSGTGRWAKAEGWMNATGQFNPETGVNTITGTGEITEPK